MNDLLEAALKYAEEGWSVFPLQVGGKRPAIEWEEWQHKRATPAQIRLWWTESPGANIGLITGEISGRVVVDVDDADPMTVYKEYATDRIQQTRKGWHLVYRHPGKHTKTRAAVRPGIDVRGDGGYIVGAPSIVDGHKYEWTQDGGLGTTPPTWTYTEEESFHGEVGREPAKQERWVSDLFRGAREGERNQAAARLAGYLASKSIPRDVAKRIIVDWNHNKNENPDSMPESEINRTVDSIYERDTRHGRIRPQDPGTGQPLEFKTLSFAQYSREYGRQEEDAKWLIEDWLPTNSIAFLASPPGSFKTWMLLEAMISIASGDPFYGKWSVPNTGPVVLIQQEDAHSEIVGRINKVMASKLGAAMEVQSDGENFYGQVYPDLPIHVYPGRSLRFDNPSMVDAFRTSISDLKPAAVFIDPLYTAVEIENYMAKAAEQMLILKQLRDETGCTFVIAHHTGKGDKDQRRQRESVDGKIDRMDLWGSQFLNAFMETGWQINRTTEEGQIKVQRHFKASGEVNNIILNMDISDEKASANINIGTAPKESKEKYFKLLSILKTERDGMSASEIAKRAKMRRNAAGSMLRELVGMKEVEKIGTGRYTKYKVVDPIGRDQGGESLQESLLVIDSPEKTS